MIASLVLALLPLVLEAGGDAAAKAEAADHRGFHLESDRHAVLSRARARVVLLTQPWLELWAPRRPAGSLGSGSGGASGTED